MTARKGKQWATFVKLNFAPSISLFTSSRFAVQGETKVMNSASAANVLYLSIYLYIFIYLFSNQYILILLMILIRIVIRICHASIS